MVIFPKDDLAKLRARHDAFERTLDREVRKHPSTDTAWKREAERQRRAERHDEERRAVGDVLDEMSAQRASLRTSLPPSHRDAEPEVIERFVQNARETLRKAGVQGVPIEELAAKPNAELESLAVYAAEGKIDAVAMVRVATARDILQRRAEQGDADADRRALAVGHQLAKLYPRVPEIAERVRTYDAYGELAEHIGYTLEAIATGGPDEGLRYESQRNALAARDAAHAAGVGGMLVTERVGVNELVRFVPEATT